MRLRLLPRTMAGQLVSLLIAGVLAAHLIAMLATSGGGGADSIHRMSRRYVLENVTAAYRLALVQHDAAAGNAMLQALDSGVARSRIGPHSAVPAAAPMDAEEQSLQAALQRQLNLAIVFVAHDLAVVRHLCESIVVLHKGRIVETGDRDAIFDAPQDAYTRALIAAVPTPDPQAARAHRARRRQSPAT